MEINKITKIKMKPYDFIWSRMVRERDGKCLYCGNPNGLNAHHFKERACKATGLMLINGVTLCTSHHVFNHQWSAHKTPEAFTKWFKQTYPQRFRAITKKAQTTMPERLAIKEFIMECITNDVDTSKKKSLPSNPKKSA